MPFETREVDGEQKTFYVPSSKELPAKLESRTAPAPVVEAPSFNVWKEFDEPLFDIEGLPKIDIDKGINSNIFTMDDSSELGTNIWEDNRTPAQKTLEEYNLITPEGELDINRYADFTSRKGEFKDVTVQESLNLQQMLKPAQVNIKGKEGYLNKLHRDLSTTNPLQPLAAKYFPWHPWAGDTKEVLTERYDNQQDPYLYQDSVGGSIRRSIEHGKGEIGRLLSFEALQRLALGYRFPEKWDRGSDDPNNSWMQDLFPSLEGIAAFDYRGPDWEGSPLYISPAQAIELGDSRKVQQFFERATIPLYYNIRGMMMMKNLLVKGGVSPHAPGYNTYRRWLETSRELRDLPGGNFGSGLVNLARTAGGRVGLGGSEYAGASGIWALLTQDPYLHPPGFTPQIEQFVTRGRTDIFDWMNVDESDSRFTRYAKLLADDISTGVLIGTALDTSGSFLRSLRNAPGHWSPRAKTFIEKARTDYGQAGFNYESFAKGDYDSFPDKAGQLFAGIKEQTNELTSKDYQFISNFKKQNQKLISAIGSLSVDSLRLNRLMKKMVWLRALKGEKVDLSKLEKRKTYTRQGNNSEEVAQFIEDNSTKSPYKEEEQLDLENNPSKVDEEINRVETELNKTEKQMEEDSIVLEDELQRNEVRRDQTISPEQQVDQLKQGVDKNLTGVTETEIQRIPIKNIKTAPQYFQVKRSGRSKLEGVSGSLEKSKKFEPVLGGVITVWRDRNALVRPEVDAIYVIDGHNRLDLAKRSGETDIDVRFINVDTIEEARAIAALQNIANTQSLKGSIEAIDVADFIREEGFTIDELAQRGLNLQNKVLTQSLSLARLPDFLYKKVRDGSLSLEKGLAYGSVEGLAEEIVLDLYKISHKSWSLVRIQQAMQMAKQAEVAIEEGVIPGLNAYFKQSDIKNLLAVRAEIAKQLKLKTKVLKVASSETQASILENVEGTTINIKNTQRDRLAANIVLNIFNQVAGYDNQVTELLKDIAGEVKGKNVASLVAERLKEVQDAIRMETENLSPQKTELDVKSEQQQKQTLTKAIEVREENKFREQESSAEEELESRGAISSDPRKINERVPNTSETVSKVPTEIKKQVDKVPDPWFPKEPETPANEQTVDVPVERVDEPIREALTSKEGRDLLPEESAQGEDLESVTTAITKIDPTVPLDFLIRNAPKDQQAGLAFNRLIEAFEQFADGRNLGPINTVGDLINILNIGRVAIEEGTQKALRDAKTTELFRRDIAPYLTKASKLAIEKALKDIETLQIYAKALQIDIGKRFKGARDNILKAGRDARDAQRSGDYGTSEKLSAILDKLGYKEEAERILPTVRPIFSDSIDISVAKGKPGKKYSMMFIEFESDVDHAIYIVTGKGRSKKHQSYYDWLTQELGIRGDIIVELGSKIRAELKSNYKANETYNLADTLAWQRDTGNVDLMTFDFEDAALGKIKDEETRKLLELLNERKNPKDPGDQLDPDLTEFRTPELPNIPNKYSNRTNNSTFRGPLALLEEQIILTQKIRRMAPDIKIEFADELTEVVTKEQASRNPNLKEGQVVRVKGKYSRRASGHLDDVIKIAQYIDGQLLSLGDKSVTAYHEAFHAVMRRYLTKGEFRLLLQGKKDIEKIAAMGTPDPVKKDLILSGKYSFPETTAIAMSVWDEFSPHVLKDKNPTWSQPLLKIRKIANAVKRHIFGMIDKDGLPAYETWDEVFVAAKSGEIGARGIAKPGSIRADGRLEPLGESKAAERDPRYEQTDLMPVDPDPNPDELSNQVEEARKQSELGNSALEQLMLSDNVRRLQSRGKDENGRYTPAIPGKRLYVARSEADIIAASGAMEKSIKDVFGGREGFTGIPKMNINQIKRDAARLLISTEFNQEKILNLYEEARGTLRANDDLITQVAMDMLLTQTMKGLGEQSLKVSSLAKNLNNVDEGFDARNKFIALWQNALTLQRVSAMAGRKDGQAQRLRQEKVEMVEPTLPLDTVLSKQLDIGGITQAKEKGLSFENGPLGEGVYFNRSGIGSDEGVSGQLLPDINIADIPTSGKSLSDFLNLINHNPEIKVTGLDEGQKIGIQNWVLDNDYDGIRFDLNGEDVVIVYDLNKANRIIESDVAEIPDTRTGRPTLRSLFELAANESRIELDKKLSPELAEQLRTGRYSAELEQVIDELASVVAVMGGRGKDSLLEQQRFMRDMSDLIGKTPDGRLTQRAFSSFIKNAYFLNMDTIFKVLGGGLFRALTLPIAQLKGANITLIKEAEAGNLLAAQMAEFRMAENKRIYKYYWNDLPNAIRLMGHAFKEDEIFGNINRGFLEDSRAKEFEVVDGGLEGQTASDRRVLKKKMTGKEWFLKPTSNPMALFWKYFSETLTSGARRSMGSMDTFLNAMVGPAVEKARLIEMEVFNLYEKGEKLTESKRLEIELKVDEELKKKWVDVIVNGKDIADGHFDSANARNAMQYVNFTDDISVKLDKKTYQYGVRKAKEAGITNNADIVAYAEDYANNRLEEFNPNSYKGKYEKQIEGAFAGTRKAMNAVSLGVQKMEEVAPVFSAVIVVNRTPLNIMKATIRYTGLGNHIIDSAWRDINHEDFFIRERALGEFAVGQTILATSVMLYATGQVEFSGFQPWDMNERQEQRNQKIQPDSIRFRMPGSQEWSAWYNVGMFDAVAPIISLVGSYQQGLKKIELRSEKDNDDELLTHIGLHVTAILNAAREGGSHAILQGALRQLTMVYELFRSIDPKNDPTTDGNQQSGIESGQWALEKLLARIISPEAINKARMEIDPTMRTIDKFDLPTNNNAILDWTVAPPIETFINSLRQAATRTPWLSYNQPAILHPTKGTPLIYDGKIGGKPLYGAMPGGDVVKLLYGAFSPTGIIKQSTQSTDVVDLEFAKLKGQGSTFLIWNKRQLNLPHGTVLTQTQLNELVKIGTKEIEINGMNMHEYLTDFILNNKMYNQLPSPEKGANIFRKGSTDTDLEGKRVPFERPRGGDENNTHIRVDKLKAVIRMFTHGLPGGKINPATGHIYGSAIDIFLTRNPQLLLDKKRNAKRKQLKELQSGGDGYDKSPAFDTDTYGPQASVNLEEWRALTADPIT